MPIESPSKKTKQKILSIGNKQILLENDIESLENEITNQLHNSSFNGKRIDKSLYEIQDCMRNCRGLSHTQLEYVRNMDKGDIFVLFVLVNQCIKTINDTLIALSSK